jgi:hypothetical protein
LALEHGLSGRQETPIPTREGLRFRFYPIAAWIGESVDCVATRCQRRLECGRAGAVLALRFSVALMPTRRRRSRGGLRAANSRTGSTRSTFEMSFPAKTRTPLGHGLYRRPRLKWGQFPSFPTPIQGTPVNYATLGGVPGTRVLAPTVTGVRPALAGDRAQGEEAWFGAQRPRVT